MNVLNCYLKTIETPGLCHLYLSTESFHLGKRERCVASRNSGGGSRGQGQKEGGKVGGTVGWEEETEGSRRQLTH